jgi:hypothetical protein
VRRLCRATVVLCDCGRSQNRYWRLARFLQHGASAPEPGYRTPRQIYQEGLWTWGRSALPTGCASPASRASSESGEMLAFAHIPTGATTNNGVDIGSRAESDRDGSRGEPCRHPIRSRPGFRDDAPAGTRGVLNDAISIYFAAATLARRRDMD